MRAAGGKAPASAPATVGVSAASRLNVPSCAPTEQGHQPSRPTTTCANDQRRSGHVVVVKISAPTARRITVKWFESPSGNISCEIDDQRPGIPDQAYCQTFTPAQSATLRPGGPVQICKGTGCVGNPPDDDTPLPYGSSTPSARFRCTSRARLGHLHHRRRHGFSYLESRYRPGTSPLTGRPVDAFGRAPVLSGTLRAVPRAANWLC